MGGFPENETEVEVIDTRIVKRITIGNFVSNVLEAFNITRGGIYTVKRLLINPGQLAKDYTGVSRHRITPPINVLIISTAVVLILANRVDAFAHIFDDSLKVNPDYPTQADIKNEIIQVFSSYFNLYLWIYIPIAASFSYIVNRKRGLNFAENLVFQTYSLSLSNFIFIAFFPVVYYSADWFFNIGILTLIFYMVYAYKVFFRKKWIRAIWESIAVYLIGTILWFFIMMIALIMISAYVASSY